MAGRYIEPSQIHTNAEKRLNHDLKLSQERTLYGLAGRYKIHDKIQTIGLDDPRLSQTFFFSLSLIGCKGLQILIIGQKRRFDKWGRL